jgi:AcrR family transcriptional regulator
LSARGSNNGNGELAASSAPVRSATAQQLIEAAVELIAERGYAGMSVDAVCRRAGIVKSGLYWNFGSKEGLLNAVVDHVAADWIEGIRQAAYRQGGALERLDHTLSELHRMMRDRPEGLRVLLVVLLERSAVDPATRAALERFFKSAREAVAQGIVDAVGPCMAARDVELVAELWLFMFEGLFLRHLIVQDEEQTNRLFTGMRETILLLVTNRLPPDTLERRQEPANEHLRRDA